MFNPTRILVPTDMSEHSDRAIRRAFDIARQFIADVYILHVVNDPVQLCTLDFCVSEEILGQFRSHLLEQARAAVHNQVGRFVSMGSVNLNTEVRIGVPHETILKAAGEMGADLIIIAPHGMTNFSKHLMGSVARHVLLGAECQVLVVK